MIGEGQDGVIGCGRSLAVRRRYQLVAGKTEVRVRVMGVREWDRYLSK